ncbi:pilus assembly protein TadG-related protein [bacterium]
MYVLEKKHYNGQIILAFALMIMGIFMFLLLVVKSAELSRERIRIQISADAAALAMATFQARALNAIADRNFILKYPSGTTTRLYGKPPPQDFSMPGIDKIDENVYEFPSKTNFEDYMRIISPYQAQQDSFYSLYDDLIVKIGEEYLRKNNAKAFIYDVEITPFDFRREQITVKYISWKDDVTGKKKALRDLVDGWISIPARKNIYSYIYVRKEFEIWNTSFLFDAVSMGEVAMDNGEIWPNPKPTFKARLSQTQDKGVLH